MENSANQIPNQDVQSPDLLPPVPLNITEVEAEAIDQDPVLIPPDRRISWIGWVAAILIFMINRKLGLCLVAVLIIFGKFPTLNLKHLPKKAGSLFKKLRS